MYTLLKKLFFWHGCLQRRAFLTSLVVCVSASLVVWSNDSIWNVRRTSYSKLVNAKSKTFFHALRCRRQQDLSPNGKNIAGLQRPRLCWNSKFELGIYQTLNLNLYVPSSNTSGVPHAVKGRLLWIEVAIVSNVDLTRRWVYHKVTNSYTVHEDASYTLQLTQGRSEESK